MALGRLEYHSGAGGFEGGMKEVTNVSYLSAFYYIGAVLPATNGSVSGVEP